MLRVTIIIAVVLQACVAHADELEVGQTVFYKLAANASAPEGKADKRATSFFGDVAEIDGDRVRVGDQWMCRDEVMSADEADEYYSDLIRKDREDAQPWLRRAWARFFNDDLDGAFSDSTRAIDLEATANAYSVRARVLAVQEHRDRAVEDFGTAIRLDPGAAAEAYLYRAEVLGEQGKLDGAISDFGESIRLKPSAEAYWNRARVYMMKKDYEPALEDADEAVRLAPDAFLPHATRGGVLAAMRRLGEAIKELSRALELPPPKQRDLVEVYSNRAVAWRETREPGKALLDLDEALRIDPENAAAHYNRGLARGDLGEHQGAIEDFEAALLVPDKHIKALNGLGHEWLALGKLDKAIDKFSRAIELDANYVDAHYNRALAWTRKEEFDRALVDVREAIRLMPDEYDAQILYASICVSSRDYASAIEGYRAAIRIDGESAKSYNGIAWIAATCPDEKFRDGKVAVEYATKACELTAWKSGGYIDTLAAAYAETGDFASAIQWQEKAIGLANSDTEKEELAKHLALYQAGKPLRDEPAERK